MYRYINAPGQRASGERGDMIGRITGKIPRRGDPPLHIAMHIATYVSQYLWVSRDAREEINASGRESVILSDCWDNIHQTPKSMVIHAVLKTSLNTRKQTDREAGKGGTFTSLHQSVLRD